MSEMAMFRQLEWTAGIIGWPGFFRIVRTVVDQKDNSSVLLQWHGAKAEVWIFDLTFRRLALLLTKNNTDEILYVVGIGCRHITGPFRWENAKFAISTPEDERRDLIAEQVTRLSDDDAGFELLCSSGVGLVRGLRSDIVHSFGDHFVSDSLVFDFPGQVDE